MYSLKLYNAFAPEFCSARTPSGRITHVTQFYYTLSRSDPLIITYHVSHVD